MHPGSDEDDDDEESLRGGRVDHSYIARLQDKI